MLTKSEAKMILGGDYIPNGSKIDITELIFRRTREDEVYQCGQQIGNDPQSGPLYCGDIAEWVHASPAGLACLCERHNPPIGNRS